MNAAGIIIGITAAALALGATAAETTASYADDLSSVYEAAQFIQAVKAGCDTAAPATRDANSGAFEVWRKRHQLLLDELDRRFMALIRGASADQGDYSKNVGRYAGAALRYREELKARFLAQPQPDVARQCAAFPDYLKGRDADLNTRFAAELKSLRQRRP